MLSQKESRSFLRKILQSPPPLPFEPTLLSALFAVTQENSTASTNDVVALIEHSQKLAVRVLALANSAAYGQEREVVSLHRAVSIVGIREIRVLTVMVGMSSIIKGVKLPPNFDADVFWQHQLDVAAVAKALAAELGGPSGVCGPSAREEDRLCMAPDEAYVAGLLHDIGKVLFAANRPELWEAVETLWKKNASQYWEAENAYWGIDHALISADVLHHWNLPILLTEPINWHHEPELAVAHKMEARLLAAANRIAHSESGAEGALCPEVVSLLPEGADAAVLGEAAAHALASVNVGTFAAFAE